RWLKNKGVTAIITAERGDGTLTRFGIEEYVADCVILLDHRVTEQVSTRRLRIVKYRGTLHGTSEYPFLIGKNGISVLPITSLTLEHRVSNKRISTGIKELDNMLDGKGFYRGSSVLLSGTAGTGKSTLSAAFVDAACSRGERCLYFAFEESTSQIQRNMRSIGVDLATHVKKGLLQFHVARPSHYGLEMHLVTMYDLIKEYNPDVVVLDPITDFFAIGSGAEVKATITRIIDFLKTRQITGFFISYTSEEEGADPSTVGISSLIDAWIILRNLEINGERQRGLFIIKSRGMPHSNQVRSYQLTDDGIRIGALDTAGRRNELNAS
ncbi:MAG TPA: circadian clock protein KaiC, partial [Anaerolineales bacterium]|nr:circadian clock protein KaiC [Anaerolineales bacterium]